MRNNKCTKINLEGVIICICPILCGTVALILLVSEHLPGRRLPFVKHSPIYAVLGCPHVVFYAPGKTRRCVRMLRASFRVALSGPDGDSWRYRTPLSHRKEDSTCKYKKVTTVRSLTDAGRHETDCSLNSSVKNSVSLSKSK
jgi:hypothetical protein